MSLRASPPAAAAIAPAPLHGPSRLAQVLEAGTGFASRKVSELQQKLDAATRDLEAAKRENSDLKRELRKLGFDDKKPDPNAPSPKDPKAGMAEWNQKSTTPPGVPDHYIEDMQGMFYDPTLPENANRF